MASACRRHPRNRTDQRPPASSRGPSFPNRGLMSRSKLSLSPSSGDGVPRPPCQRTAEPVRRIYCGSEWKAVGSCCPVGWAQGVTTSLRGAPALRCSQVWLMSSSRRGERLVRGPFRGRPRRPGRRPGSGRIAPPAGPPSRLPPGPAPSHRSGGERGSPAPPIRRSRPPRGRRPGRGQGRPDREAGRIRDRYQLGQRAVRSGRAGQVAAGAVAELHDRLVAGDAGGLEPAKRELVVHDEDIERIQGRRDQRRISPSVGIGWAAHPTGLARVNPLLKVSRREADHSQPCRQAGDKASPDHGDSRDRSTAEQIHHGQA